LIADAWSAYAAALPALGAAAQRWCHTLVDLPELAAGLVNAAAHRV
jgi:hypothetical protein